MTTATAITIKSERFALVPYLEYEELLARAAGEQLPDMPAADKHGNRPAVEAVRVMIARDIITSRIKAGWTQEQLAKRAKVSAETISRLESAKHKPQAATVEKIDAAFKKAGV
jgi:ribosome-binding protein aMBF1 (putative translation factor)